MLYAYLDESGTHTGAPVVVAGGFMATVAAWDEFSRAWEVQLRKVGVSSYHATDLEHPGYGEFSGWTAKKRLGFQRRFFALIRRAAPYSAACGIAFADYEAVVPVDREFRRTLGSAYLCCLRACVLKMLERSHEVGVDDGVTFMLEDRPKPPGIESKGDITEWFERWKRVDSRVQFAGFWNKRRVLPLQAADFAAFELKKELQNRVLGGAPAARDPRKSLLALVTNDWMDGFLMDRDGLAGLVARAGGAS